MKDWRRQRGLLRRLIARSGGSASGATPGKRAKLWNHEDAQSADHRAVLEKIATDVPIRRRTRDRGEAALDWDPPAQCFCPHSPLPISVRPARARRDDAARAASWHCALFERLQAIRSAGARGSGGGVA
jgi:hypothetical protein